MPAVVDTLTVNFVGDLPGGSSGDMCVVATDADYVNASGLLRENLAQEYRAFWVREEHHFKWIEAQVEHCGLRMHRAITFARTTPASLLRDRWGMEIPGWLTDQMILDSELLEVFLPPEATNVGPGLLASLFGLLPGAFPFHRAGFLAQKASEPGVIDALKKPVFAAAWKAVLADWAQAESLVSSFCERLAQNPQKLWADLTTWRLLDRYPESALDYALDPATVAFLRTFPADSLQEMTLSPEGRQLAVDQIEQIFGSAKTGVLTHTKFRHLLEAVSGELVEEFTGIESLLGKAEFDISGADVAEIRSRFKTCSGMSAVRLARMGLYVRPPKPVEMAENESFDAASWVRWSQEQYFPYRWWQIERRMTDPDVERSVMAFSAWYCQNFAQVQGEADLSAIQTISRWRERILSDQVSLILLVDNLPWFFWELLEKALAASGLHRHESSASFVPLPSHTSVCKPLIVAGRVDASGSEYLKMLSARSKDEWNTRPVHYASGVDQLASLQLGSDPSVVLLNYLAADETLHGDAEASGSSWSEQLALLYGNLAQAVGDFARRASSGTGKEVGLYVLTDHGSTFVLPEERLSADAQLTKKLFPNEKYRSATLNTVEADQIPENLWTLGYRFVSPFAKDVHFIPRGHNTVASPGTRPIFCHGGATPEEVIVPNGIFRLYPASWTLPRLRFLDIDLSAGHARFYIKRIVPIQIEIQNANSEECRLESIEVHPSVADVREFDTVVIPAHGTSTTTASLYFSAAATSVSTITFNLSLRIGQDALSQKIELPVKISSATSGGLDLKNL